MINQYTDLQKLFRLIFDSDSDSISMNVFTVDEREIMDELLLFKKSAAVRNTPIVVKTNNGVTKLDIVEVV